MPGLSAWAVRRPVAALLTWVIAVTAIAAAALTFRGDFNDTFALPDTESTRAQELLAARGSGTAGSAPTAAIVWSPATGRADSPGVLATMKPILEGAAGLASVTCVTVPGQQSIPPQCPPLPASVSPDGRVAYAQVSFAADGEIPVADARLILEEVRAANGAELAVGASGQALDYAAQELPSSEALGVILAIVILLIAFGSLIAAGLPIVVAIVGLVAGQLAILGVTAVMDVATVAPTLAAMIGLGVGIDYALFIVNRYRSALLAGTAPQPAALLAMATAGRAVLFAAATVVVALLGLFTIGMDFFNGLATAAALTVVSVMLAALWLLPALLSLLGLRTLGGRLPWGRRPGDLRPEGRRWAHLGGVLQRRPALPIVGVLAALLLLASPVLGLRLGFADDSGKPTGSSARIAYDLIATGFGPGVNGPFVAAIALPPTDQAAAYTSVVTTLSATQGVAATLPSLDLLPLALQSPGIFGEDGRIGVVQVIPATAPQDPATAALLERLRTEVAPGLADQTGAVLSFGGPQAITNDFTTVLTTALPQFLLIVVGLGFLALVVLFRSLLIPLTAVVTSLLSFAAGLGIAVAVFQWGWLGSAIGLTATGPILPFLPVMVFAILFGLSMDYQVFLVSRMQEEWQHTGDTARAVRLGLAGAGRVVAIAATIMASVFIAFVPSTDTTIKLFGLTLAMAVLIDAFLVRLLLVPALMSVMGKANWWLPGWLDRILPSVRIEPEDPLLEDEDTRLPGESPRTDPVPVAGTAAGTPPVV
ncbi:MAG: MMPL family transporter [Actinomycetales bacterium]|nr:MMPL family transporter [Actinomycetales bacterium]